MRTILTDKKVVAWALYDWGNSAFATTVVAGFFPIFYSTLSSDLSVTDSQFWFNMTLAISSALVAVAAPVLGAIADSGSSRKKFLATFSLLGILMCVGLAWVGAGMWWAALIVYGLGQIGFSTSMIFYDALLVEVSSGEDMDVVSGYGYALGYIGGGLLFLVNVLMVTQFEWFGIPDQASALSLSFVSVGVWWTVFTLPLLYVVEEPQESQGSAAVSKTETIRQGFAHLAETFREIRKLKYVLLFLISYWLYIDGLGTIFRTAVFFADRILNLPPESLITALLLTQFISFPSALFFGWLGQRIGPKRGILIGLLVYTIVVIYAWKWLNSAVDFYWLAATIGLVQGGVQSLSRSLFARLIPQSKTTEFFGFYNMVGKFASIFGPILMALVPIVFVGGSARDSILVLVILFVSGGYLLYRLDVDKAVLATQALDDHNSTT